MYIAGMVVPVLLLASSQVFANDFYAGVKFAQVSVDYPGSGFGTTTDSDVGTGLVLGRSLNGVDVELELMTASVDSDEVSIESVDIDTIAVYAVYRSTGDMYFKGKAGFISESVTMKTIYGNRSADDSGLSYGIGGGYRFGNLAVEAEYTIIEADVDALSLGLNYYF